MISSSHSVPRRKQFVTHVATGFATYVTSTFTSIAVAALYIITVTGCAFVASAPPLPPDTPRTPVNVMPPNAHGR